MEKGTPPQVKDEGVRTKIFDWRVPMTVGSAPVAAVGTLEWVPAGVVGLLDRPDRRRSAAAASWRSPALAFLLRGAAAPAAARRREPTAARKTADEAW